MNSAFAFAVAIIFRLGQAGNDQLFSDNGQKDFLDGGSGLDKAQIDQGLDSAKNIEKFIT